MALPACGRCGQTDPQRMIGLMTLWFGPFVDMEPGYGYFYLCPPCYRDHIQPHMDELQGRLAELHPLAHHLGLNHDDPTVPDPADPDGTGDQDGDHDGDGGAVAAGAGPGGFEGETEGADRQSSGS